MGWILVLKGLKDSPGVLTAGSRFRKWLAPPVRRSYGDEGRRRKGA